MRARARARERFSFQVPYPGMLFARYYHIAGLAFEALLITNDALTDNQWDIPNGSERNCCAGSSRTELRSLVQQLTQNNNLLHPAYRQQCLRKACRKGAV